MPRTARLVLRTGDPELDGPSLHEAWSDREAIEWWHLPAPVDLDETRQRIATFGPGQSVIALDDQAPAIGHVGFVTTVRGTRSPFGYFLARPHWGRGIAREAAHAMLAHGFDELGLAGAELWIYEGNHRSEGLARRLGATMRGRFTAFAPRRGRSFETLVYGITATEFGATEPVAEPAGTLALVPQLGVVDVRATIAFWVDQLGFSVAWAVGDPPETVALTRADWSPAVAEIRFNQRDQTAELHGTLNIAVRGLDRLHDELVARGTAVDQAPTAMPWGLREMVVTDPNGFVIRFAEPGTT